MHLGWHMKLFLLNINIGAQLLGHRVSVYLALEGLQSFFQNGFAITHSTINARTFQLLYIPAKSC